jgi:hypothetical protein
MLGGIIIERADGTDSRIIGQDVIPAGLTGLDGGGWSPSGKYFAAYVSPPMDYIPNLGNGYVIDTKGNQVAGWLQDVAFIGAMDWSPNGDDLLFVAGNTDGYWNTRRGFFFWIVDPHKNRAVVEYGGSYDSVYVFSDPSWQEDHIIVYLTSYDAPSQEYLRLTMFFDGKINKELISEQEFLENMSLPNSETTNHLFEGRLVSPSGNYETEGIQPTKLRNLKTNLQVELPVHSQGAVCRSFLWSSDEQYLITNDGTLIDRDCHLSVMGVTDANGKLWRELGGCYWHVSQCIDWLPSQVEISNLPIGKPIHIQLDAIATESADTLYPSSAELELMKLQCNKTLSADMPNWYILEKETEEKLFELYDELSCPIDEAFEVIVAHNAQVNLLATYVFRGSKYAGEGFVSIWAEQDGIWHRINQLNTYGYDLEFTPDGKYLRARDSQAWKIYSVEDILRTAREIE